MRMKPLVLSISVKDVREGPFTMFVELRRLASIP